MVCWDLSGREVYEGRGTPFLPSHHIKCGCLGLTSICLYFPKDPGSCWRHPGPFRPVSGVHHGSLGRTNSPDAMDWEGPEQGSRPGADWVQYLHRPGLSSSPFFLLLLRYAIPHPAFNSLYHIPGILFISLYCCLWQESFSSNSSPLCNLLHPFPDWSLSAPHFPLVLGFDFSWVLSFKQALVSQCQIQTKSVLRGEEFLAEYIDCNDGEWSGFGVMCVVWNKKGEKRQAAWHWGPCCPL